MLFCLTLKRTLIGASVNHDVRWNGMECHMHFGNLDLIILMEGELVQVPTAVQTLHSAGLDAIAEAFEELQLHALEAHAPKIDLLLSLIMGG